MSTPEELAIRKIQLALNKAKREISRPVYDAVDTVWILESYLSEIQHSLNTLYNSDFPEEI